MPTTPKPPSDLRPSGRLPRVSLSAAAPVELTAAESEGGRPRFSILGYTGAQVRVRGWYTPLIVDLAGLKPASQSIPALRDHDTSRIVGQTDAVAVGSDVRLSGVITGDNEDAREVVSQSANGFRWQASIGADPVREEYLKPGHKATVNGRKVAGPMVIVREAVLKEISFVALGADGSTSASVAASDPMASQSRDATMKFDEWLQAKGFDPAALDDAQKAALKLAFDAEAAAPEEGGDDDPAPAPRARKVAAGGSRSIDDIFAEQKRERDRVEEITRIVEAAVVSRPLMLDTLERMAKAAIAAKTSPLEFKVKVFEATMDTPGAPAAHVRPSLSDQKNASKIVEAAVCLSAGLGTPEKHFDDQVLNAASDRFKHRLGLVEVLMLSARENGHHGLSPRDVEGLLRASFEPGIRASGFSTISLPNILSNAANKFLIDAFNHVESAWRAVAERVPVSDFKTITSHSLTGDLEYEEVGPAGEIKHGTLGEEVYTNRAKSYGRMLAITYQDIRNDDLGALTRVPRRLGRGGALKINDVFWSLFLDNSTFFTALRGNYLEGATAGTNDTRMNIEGLTRAEGEFFDQTDPDGKPLGVAPRVLLVPSALNAAASQLMNSTEVRDNSAGASYGVANPHAGKFTVVRSSYLSNSSYTGNSATAWYLLADPNDVATMQIAFLDGQEMPRVESAAADFNTLGIQMRGVHHFGVGRMEYRGGVKMKGAA